MLSRAHRMTSSRDFTDVTRTGGRAGSTTLVAHVLLPAGDVAAAPAQIGFIVNKSVGTAVARNRVRRRLRHACRPLVTELPPATRVVLRALPAAAHADTAQLADDLTSTVRRATRKAGQAVGA